LIVGRKQRFKALAQGSIAIAHRIQEDRAFLGRFFDRHSKQGRFAFL
jgi:hypothetical protein